MTGTARNNRQKDRARWPPRHRARAAATALDLASATRERNLAHPAIQVRTNLSQVRSVSPSRQWLRSLAVLVGERLELCQFRDEVGDQHGCCSGTRDRQPTGRWSQTGCGRSGGDQGHVLQVGVRSQGMSVSDGRAAVHSGACRSAGSGQNRPGARVESAGSKVGPVDVPALMPGLPHSAEPQWHIRHGVFSRLLTFTARRQATGSGVSAAARTTAARWPRSGSWRRSGRRPG